MNRFELVKNIIENIENGVFVEIGTHEGGFANHILANSKNSVLYCVDPYISYNEYDDGINNVTGDGLYNKTRTHLTSLYGERVKFIRKFSEEALSDIPECIDFLYIDGNHDYTYVTKDLELYYPKVKANCYIVGDDAVDTDENKRDAKGNVLVTWSPGCYGNYGVIKSFRDFCLKNTLNGEIVGNQYVIKK